MVCRERKEGVGRVGVERKEEMGRMKMKMKMKKEEEERWMCRGTWD